MPAKKRVLFLCTGNSARSQMAEGLLRQMAGDRFEVSSAGTHPKGMHPRSVEVMNEIGIDISAHRSRSVDEFLGQDFDYVITVCDKARQNCPVFHAKAERIHQSFADPAALEGNDHDRLSLFRQVRDEIREWMAGFISRCDSSSARI